MTNYVFNISDWNYIKIVSNDYIELVRKIAKINEIDAYVSDFNVHICNTERLSIMLGDSTLNQDTLENRIKNVLLDGPKIFVEIKAALHDVDPFLLNKALLKMEEDQEIDFHSATGLWRVE